MGKGILAIVIPLMALCLRMIVMDGMQRWQNRDKSTPKKKKTKPKEYDHQWPEDDE